MIPSLLGSSLGEDEHLRVLAPLSPRLSPRHRHPQAIQSGGDMLRAESSSGSLRAKPVSPETFQGLCAAVQDPAQTATYCRFSGKGMTSAQMDKFCQVCPATTSITGWNFSKNNFGDEGLRCMADFIVKNCGRMKSLDMSENDFSSDGIQFLKDRLLSAPDFYLLTKLECGNSSVMMNEKKYARWQQRVEALERIVLSNRSVEKCPQTGVLNLSYRGLTEPPLWLSCSTPVSPQTITSLDMSNNSLSCIPSEIQLMIGLQTLNLSHNSISEIHCRLLQCQDLRSLNLSHNCIKEIPSWMGLMDLHTLLADHNPIKTVSHVLLTNKALVNLELASTPFLSSIASSKVASIPLAHLSAIHHSMHTDPVPLVRLFVVGTPQSGKTSLLTALRRVAEDRQDSSERSSDEPPVISSLRRINLPPSVTPVLTETDFEAKAHGLRFRSLELSGSGCYDYGSHPSIISGGALYLVVFSALDHHGEDKIKFWLSCLSKLRQVSVIIVITHADQIGDGNDLYSRIEQISANSVRSNFAVSSIFSLSTDPRFFTVDAFRDLLQQMVSHATSLKLGGSLSVPRSFLTAAELIVDQNRCTGYFSFTLRDFERIALRCSIPETHVQKLITFVRRIGVIFYLEEENLYPREKEGPSDPDLKLPAAQDGIFIPSVWLCEILSQMEFFASGSHPSSVVKKVTRLSPSEVNTVWDTSIVTPSSAAQLWRVLELLGLGYIDQKDSNPSVRHSVGEIIIPSLLPTKEPSLSELSSWWSTSSTDETSRMYRFKSLPVGMFRKIFSHILHLNIWHPVRAWRTGVCLSPLSFEKSKRIALKKQSLYVLKAVSLNVAAVAQHKPSFGITPFLSAPDLTAGVDTFLTGHDTAYCDPSGLGMILDCAGDPLRHSPSPPVRSHDVDSLLAALTEPSLRIWISALNFDSNTKDLMSTFSIRIRGSARARYHALIFLSQAIDTFITNLFRGTEAETLVPCPKCRLLVDEALELREIRKRVSTRDLPTQSSAEVAPSFSSTFSSSSSSSSSSSTATCSSSSRPESQPPQLTPEERASVSPWLLALLERIISNDPALTKMALPSCSLSLSETKTLARALSFNIVLHKARLCEGAFAKPDKSLESLVTTLYSLGKIDSLQCLELNQNEISRLPGTFGNVFPGITRLCLANNCITKLPESFSALTLLMDLDLSSNRLTEFPPWSVLSGFASSLVSLQLHRNRISQLPSSAVSGLVLLTTFTAHHNPIKDVHPKILKAGGGQLLDYIRSRPETIENPRGARNAIKRATSLLRKKKPAPEKPAPDPGPSSTRTTIEAITFDDPSPGISPQNLISAPVGLFEFDVPFVPEVVPPLRLADALASKRPSSAALPITSSRHLTGGSPLSKQLQLRGSLFTTSSSEGADSFPVDPMLNIVPNRPSMSSIPKELIPAPRRQGVSVHAFELNELVSLVYQAESTVACPICNNDLRIDELAPDIAFTMFPGVKFTWDSLLDLQELGSGSAALVLRAVYRPEDPELRQKVVAIKKLKTEVSSSVEVFAEFRREAWLMTSLRHPNLVMLLGLCLDPLAMMLEFMDAGDLQTYLLGADNPISWSLRAQLAFDIASGMHYLHSQTTPVVHRDLKSPNVLLKSSTSKKRPVAKIADFGLSHALAFTDTVVQKSAEGLENCIWHAPEVINSKTYDTRSDVYAYGIILWELAARTNPFAEILWMTQIEDSVKSGIRPTLDLDWPKPYIDLMTECWAQDPRLRPSFKGILIRIRNFVDRQLNERQQS